MATKSSVAQPVTTRRERARVAKVFQGQGRTHQEFRDECDINQIMATWRRTGQTPHLQRGQPWYGDFENADDFQTAVNRVRQAQDQFMALPSYVRDYCNNDPATFIELLADPQACEEMEAIGLRLDEAREGSSERSEGASEKPSPSKPTHAPPKADPPAEGDQSE